MRITEEKLQKKRRSLIERTALVLSVSDDVAERLLAAPRKQSLRINALKADESVVDELIKLGWEGKAYDWVQGCYSIDHNLEAVRDSDLFADGRVYIQNASSWLPVLALDPQTGEKILDVAAAPGGKASHVAAVTSNQAELWVNDNSRTRLMKMRRNFERLGVEAECTLYDARFLAKYMDGESFDRVLLDAPCSGEGLVDINEPKTLETWSVAAIKRLQALQRRLLGEAWKLLKSGGTLVYSTCTMAPEENELVIDWFLKRHDEAMIESVAFENSARVPPIMSWNGKSLNVQIQHALRLRPAGEFEAFFVCKLRKIDNTPEPEYYQG